MLAYRIGPDPETQIIPHWIVFFFAEANAPVSASSFGIECGLEVFKQLVESAPPTHENEGELRISTTPFFLMGSCSHHRQAEPEAVYPVALYLPTGCFKREVSHDTKVAIHITTMEIKPLETVKGEVAGGYGNKK